MTIVIVDGPPSDGTTLLLCTPPREYCGGAGGISSVYSSPGHGVVRRV